MNILLLVSLIGLSFSGFVIALYGILAQNKIDEIILEGLNNDYFIDKDEDFYYFSPKISKWSSGTFFQSKMSFIYGFSLVLFSIISSLFFFHWSICFVIVIFGYLLYLILSYSLGYLVQIISFIILLLSFIYVVYEILKILFD